MVKPVRLNGRLIGRGFPCFIIAEAGVNHNGSLALARKLVDAAAKAGADAVKFQTFRAESLATETAPLASYQKAYMGLKGSQQEMLRRLELSPEHHEALLHHCQKRKILFLSTPFDPLSAGFLFHLGVKGFKISSGDLTNLPFLTHVAKMRRPIILSTGMATLAEVSRAVSVVRDAGNAQIILLHCVSAYPARPRDMNVRALQSLSGSFPHPVGLSDHTTGTSVALASVALGASVIEKHLTLDKMLDGPDHGFSLDPREFTELVKGIREVESALGDGVKRPQAVEQGLIKVARKSLASARPLLRGNRVSVEDVTALRPGTGLNPSVLPALLGRRVRRNIPPGVLLKKVWFS